MKCPKCSASEIVSTMATELGVGRDEMPSLCAGCGGMWIPGHTALRAIFDQTTWRPSVALTTAPDVAHERKTGNCPRGHGLLMRAKVYEEEPYYLEKCPKCGGYWFDHGEWDRLLGSRDRVHLQEFWCDAWQVRKQREQREQLAERALIERLGEGLFLEIKALSAKLRDHPHKDQALALLREQMNTRQG